MPSSWVLIGDWIFKRTFLNVSRHTENVTLFGPHFGDSEPNQSETVQQPRIWSQFHVWSGFYQEFPDCWNLFHYFPKLTSRLNQVQP